MTIESALVTHLVSELSCDRIYPARLLQGTELPAITYQRISTSRVQTHDQTANGLATMRMQFSIYAKTFSDMVDVVVELREVLLGYKGTLSNIRVDAILSEGEWAGYEPEADLFYTMADYMISHEE